MSTRDIEKSLKDLYDVEISSGLINQVTKGQRGSERLAESSLGCVISHRYPRRIP